MHHWWRGDWLIIVCLPTRITSQSLRPITHTMLTPPGTLCTLKLIYVRVTPRQRSSFQISDWLVWQLRDCVRGMYGNQVQGRKVAGSSKQATVEDSRVTLQSTVDDVEKHVMSLVAVNIKYNVQTKYITEIGLF